MMFVYPLNDKPHISLNLAKSTTNNLVTVSSQFAFSVILIRNKSTIFIKYSNTNVTFNVTLWSEIHKIDYYENKIKLNFYVNDSL